MDLHEILDRATDEIAPVPGLAARALGEARRRRMRARGYGAALVAAAGVVVLVVSVRVVTPSERGEQRPADPATEVPSDVRVGEEWDPRDVDDLPAAPASVAPLLPDLLDPPADVVRLAEGPIPAAVLAVERRSDVLMLAVDGSWRQVTCDNGSLSPDGTRLLVSEEDGSAQVWDLGSGTWTAVPRPGGALDWDYERWRWLGDGSLFFDDRAGGFVVDPADGSSERVQRPWPTSTWWSSDEGGAIVESADHAQPAVLTDWVGGERRRVPMDATGRLASLVVDADTVVGTTYDGEPGFRLVAARRTDLQPVAVRPVLDYDGNYSNWGLRPLALLDDGTVLVRVAVPGRASRDGWRLVAWEPAAGELSVVLRSDASAVQPVSFASDLL
jgi:hypothetical protein